MSKAQYALARVILGGATVLGMVGSMGLTPANATAENGASISGTVTLPAGAPPEWMDAVSVSANSMSDTEFGGPVGVDRSTGQYTINGLAAGSYRVSFAGGGSGLISEYFDGTTDRAKAVPVATSEASPATGIDASLEAGATISGTVTLPAGAPAEWMSVVSVSATSFSGGGAGGFALVDSASGGYTISGLAPGTYRVRFSVSNFGPSDGPGQTNLIAEYFEDTTDYASAVPVETSVASPATAIDASLEAGATISGTVTLPADAPAEWMGAMRVSASPFRGWGPGNSASVDPATGQYTIAGLSSGPYRVSFSGGGTGLISEYFDDTTDYASAVPVETSADSPAVGIDAALETGATISGTVTLPAGAPDEWMDAVSVMAYSMSGQGTGQFARVDRATGSYTLRGLASGAYRVSFSVSSSGPPGSPAQTNLLSEYFDDAPDYESAVPVETSLAAPAVGIDAVLEAAASVSGTVRDSGGAAIEGIAITLLDSASGSARLGWTRTDASGEYTLNGLRAGTYKILVGNTDEASAYQRTFIGGATFLSAATLDVAFGAVITDRDALLKSVEPNAPQPAKPTLSTRGPTNDLASVTWPAPASVAPVIAYNMSFGNFVWGDGDLRAATDSNSVEVHTRMGSLVVLVAALTASAEGDARAVVVNDPASPTAPTLRVVRTGSSMALSASSSVPSDAQWWFGILPAGSGVTGPIWEQASSNSYTFADVDPDSEVQVFAAWRSGDKISQIATLTSEPNRPIEASVHPWFQAKYAELGGLSGMGKALKDMECQSASCWQEFANGVLTSDGKQIVKLSTAYVKTWLTAGGPNGALGLVAGPESCFGTYCVVPFTHGVIKWTPNVGVKAIPVHGWFESAWKAQGGVSGSIGSPLAEMRCQSSSCWQEFTGGVLTSDGRQIVKLSTAYVSTWLAWGGPDGDLGLVAGAESCHGAYCQTPFTGGVVVWVPDRGVFPVAKTWFYNAWAARGGVSGSLGLPTDSMRCQASACYQSFQNGTLTSSTSGIEALSTAYVDTWLAGGGPDGPLGLLTGAEACFGTYCKVPFQRGLMVWEPANGVRSLTGSALAEWEASHSLQNPGDIKNCSDFANWAQAQAWFDLYYPLFGDVAKLDGNNDGSACDSLR